MVPSQWEALRQLDITQADPNSLVDIQTLQIPGEAPLAERLTQFLSQIQNPYAFRVGKTPVKIRFTQGGPTLEEALASYLTAIRQGR